MGTPEDLESGVQGQPDQISEEISLIFFYLKTRGHHLHSHSSRQSHRSRHKHSHLDQSHKRSTTLLHRAPSRTASRRTPKSKDPRLDQRELNKMASKPVKCVINPPILPGPSLTNVCQSSSSKYSRLKSTNYIQQW